MSHEKFAAKIAYVCIFTRTVEEAAENLTRLIASGDCGFDEGTTMWREVLTDILTTPEELCQLNRFGAEFTANQWGQILEQVRAALIAPSEAGK